MPCCQEGTCQGRMKWKNLEVPHGCPGVGKGLSLSGAGGISNWVSYLDTITMRNLGSGVQGYSQLGAPTV